MKERITVPIYEFVCQACGNEFEQILSFSENRMPTCAKCGSDQVVRQVGRPAIHFKGSGWYINDSKKSSDKSGGASKNSASGESNKSTTENTSTSESKPETKVETKSESSSSPAPVASE